MKSYSLILMMISVLFISVQPEKQPTMGRTNRDLIKVHGRINRLKEVEPGDESEIDLWMKVCVDCPKQLGGLTESSLQLDAEGHPHIAYGGDHIYYARNDGLDWHIETVDNYSQSVGDVSLALDGAGYPHVCYSEGEGTLKYAYKNASGWYFQTVDSEGSWASLTLDEDGYPHVSYRGEGRSLRYAYLDETGWHIQIVDSVGLCVTSPLLIDEEGFPHIIFSEKRAGIFCSFLMYAYQDADGWHIQIVDSDGRGISLALDGDGDPHISYSGDGNLKYAHQDLGEW